MVKVHESEFTRPAPEALQF